MTENGGDECGEDDEWGDLITAPNQRLISDEFFVLKSEEIDNSLCYENDEDLKSMRNVSDGEIGDVNCGFSDCNVWSQFVTIPSGINMDSVLDSPVMLPNSQGSPTTGTFPFPHLDHEMLGINSAIDDDSCDSNSFAYQQQAGGPLLWPCISDLQNQQPILSEFPGTFPKETVSKGCASAKDLHTTEGFKVLNNTNNNISNGTVKPSRTENQTSPMRNSEDGYNWRKYGQKQVKGSEYPRSYYKCTHPNCQVKKKVERSHDGHITEIIYKGAHNHQGQRSINGSTDVNNISICRTQDPTIDNSDLISPNQGKGVFGNPELLSSSTNYDINEEDETHVGILTDEADDDKSDLKRRKKGSCLLETSLVTRAMREPRVVVQIESEIDILDDGYRWRKYGQKVVKGNPNPRSYYKCTTVGCPVRKHVERASDDLKSVLTTYEGKHNHEIPAAKNSIHNHTNMDHRPTTNTPNQSLSRIPNIPKPEPPLHFNRKLNNELIPSNFTDPNSIYQKKYAPFQNPLSFGSIIPDFPISPMSMPISPSTNMVNHVGFGFNNNGKRPHEPQSYGRYLKPKMEQDDGFYDAFMRPPDHVNDANSRYCRVIPSFLS